MKGTNALTMMAIASGLFNRRKKPEPMMEKKGGENAFIRCPACNKTLHRTISRCPYCSTFLEVKCPNCDRNTNRSYPQCPYCGVSLKDAK